MVSYRDQEAARAKELHVVDQRTEEEKAAEAAATAEMLKVCARSVSFRPPAFFVIARQLVSQSPLLHSLRPARCSLRLAVVPFGEGIPWIQSG